MVTSDKLKELIKHMTGEKAKLSTPQQEKKLSTKYATSDRTSPTTSLYPTYSNMYMTF